MRPTLTALRQQGWQRSFALLWSTTVLSSMAHFLLLLTLSIRIFRTTGSSLAASIVFAVPWVTPLLCARLIRYVCNRFETRDLLPVVELLSGALTILIGLLADLDPWLVSGLLIPRGAMEGLSKTARMVAIKTLVPPQALQTLNPLLNTALPLGTALGSLVGALLASHQSLPGVAAICLALFLGAGLLSRQIERQPAAQQPAAITGSLVREAIRLFAAHPPVLQQFILLSLTVGVFQAYHNVARTVYPLDYLGATDSSVMLLQVVTSCAVILGALAVAYATRRYGAFSLPDVALMTATCLGMLTILLVDRLWLAFCCYFIFIFLFEVAYCKFQTAMIASCPQNRIALLSTCTISALPLLIGINLSFSSWLVDRIGFVRTTIALALVTLLFTWGMQLRRALAQRRSDRASETELAHVE